MIGDPDGVYALTHALDGVLDGHDALDDDLHRGVLPEPGDVLGPINGHPSEEWITFQERDWSIREATYLASAEPPWEAAFIESCLIAWTESALGQPTSPVP